MFWDDLKKIKEEVAVLKHSLLRIEHAILEVKTKQMGNDDISKGQSEKVEQLRDFIHDIFSSEDEYSTLNRIHDKLNILVNDEERKQTVQLAQVTLDKFEDYMKNVDKLNSMINEFKGCVSLARGALEERKELDKQTKETEKLADCIKEIYQAMRNFIAAGNSIEKAKFFKIDAIYDAVCLKKEKKSPKKRKPVKKKDAPASLSQ